VSDDETDVGAARVGTRILDHEMDRVKWDTAHGRSVLLGRHPRLVVPARLLGRRRRHHRRRAGRWKAATRASEIHQGEVVVEVVPAFELSVDPNARFMDDARWCVRTVSLTKEGCYEKYGVVPPTDLPGMNLVDEVYALTDKAGRTAPTSRPCRSTRCGSARQPHRTRGRRDHLGRHTVLEKKPFPYEHGQLPFVQFDLLPGMGMREGRTWLTDLIAIQADYNDARSREASIRRVMCRSWSSPSARSTSSGSAPGSRDPVQPERQPAQLPDARRPLDGPARDRDEPCADEMGERAGQADVSSGTPRRRCRPPRSWRSRKPTTPSSPSR
jgi:hypothetical protein